MKQESKSIRDFKPGDIVTRVEPATTVESGGLFTMGGIRYDSNYIGEKLIYLGIANGCAYFEPTDELSIALEKGVPIRLMLYKFEDGWAHYIDPMTLVNAKPVSKYQSMSNESLVDGLDAALSTEDYEEASRIKHELDKRDI